jgi:hypothetical protein
MMLGRDGEAGALAPGARIGLTFANADALVLSGSASG